MTPVERVQTAVGRLSALDHAATWGPWTAGESWAGKLAILGTSGEPVAVVSGIANPTETARADAALIAALRSLAPVIVARLRFVLGEMGGLKSERGQAMGLRTLFPDALPLADAVLAATGGAS